MLANLTTQHQAPCRTVPRASNGPRPQSRIGKKPIAVPSDVDVQVEQGTCLTVKVPAHQHLWLLTIGCGAAAVELCKRCSCTDDTHVVSPAICAGLNVQEHPS